MNDSVSTVPIEREFTRVQKDDIELGWFSISHNFIIDKNQRRKNYGKWFCIYANGKKIFRLLKFSPNLKYIKGDEQIALDWLGHITLNGFEPDNEKMRLNYLIRPARFYEIIIANINHPNQGLRAAYRLAILSLILSILFFLN